MPELSQFIWMDTFLELPKDESTDLMNAILFFRSYIVQNKSAKGFCWPPKDLPWWYGKATPFQARAKPNCSVYINTSRMDTIHFLTDQLPSQPSYVVNDGRTMDVWEVDIPFGNMPGWFKVFPGPNSGNYPDQWVKADDCEQVT